MASSVGDAGNAGLKLLLEHSDSTGALDPSLAIEFRILLCEELSTHEASMQASFERWALRSERALQALEQKLEAGGPVLPAAFSAEDQPPRGTFVHDAEMASADDDLGWQNCPGRRQFSSGLFSATELFRPGGAGPRALDSRKVTVATEAPSDSIRADWQDADIKLEEEEVNRKAISRVGGSRISDTMEETKSKNPRAGQSGARFSLGSVDGETVPPASVYHAYLNTVVHSSYFDLLCGMMICSNTILIGVETDYLTTHMQSSALLRQLQNVLNAWYITELCLRIAAERSLFWSGKDKAWNFFDAFLVTTSIIDLVLEAWLVNGLRVTRVLRAMRLLRVARTLRIVRMLRYLREFRKMVYAMATCLQTLFCSLTLLFFVMYTFAIWLTQGVSEHIMNLDPDERDGSSQVSELREHWASLSISIYTLYKSITAGMSWGDAALPLLEVSSFYMGLFLAFMSISVFGVLNIVTSVFVESALQSAQHSRELLVQEKAKDKELYVSHLKQIFREIDTDGSGMLSEDELVEFLENTDQQLQTYFEALEVNASHATVLFRLLDTDGSGCIDYEEFCEGCMQLRGEARSFDIHCMIYENRRMQRWWTKFMAHVETEIQTLRRETRMSRPSIVAPSVPPVAPVHPRDLDMLGTAWTGQAPPQSPREIPGEDSELAGVRLSSGPDGSGPGFALAYLSRTDSSLSSGGVTMFAV